MGNTPPKTLGAAGKAIFRRLQREYNIADAGGLELLALVGRCADIEALAMAETVRDGLTVIDRYEQRRPHPGLSVARDARSQMLSALRLLHLDVEPLKGIGRPGGA